MGLQKIDPVKKKQEDEVINQLLKYIDENRSLVFHAGAGAGKTYALIQSLRHVILKEGRKLEAHNQKIMCITYTNVATNHIKSQIGNSNLVVVSTIHERLWELIQQYQEELVQIHREKLQEEIEFTLEYLEENEKCKAYNSLSQEEREKFKNIVLERKEEFYKSYAMNAAGCRAIFSAYLEEFPDMLKSVDKFRDITLRIYKVDNYEECIKKIDKGTLGYRKVEYNAMYNRDRLERMRISHDTLLQYGKKIVLKYPRLRNIIIDQYPYIFIDEYQDTSQEVVEIMNLLNQYGNEIGHSVFVGYYGDSVQSIYEDGIGNRLQSVHSGLQIVEKKLNRRSYQEIIDIANAIRLDGIEQESIFIDCRGGSVCYDSENTVEKAIQECKQKWNVSRENPLHCFVLKNEEVAEKSGIKELYDAFKKVQAYKGSNYMQLNTELLSNDVKKLGDIQSFIYRVLELYINIRNVDTMVEEILYGERKLYSNINIVRLRGIKKELQSISGETLEDYLKEVCRHHEATKLGEVKKVIEMLLDMDYTQVQYEQIVAFFMNKLEGSATQNESENESLERVENILRIPMEVYEKWYQFINRNLQDEVIYHTYHSTKGLEFDNVLIALEDGFGSSKKDKTFLCNFLENYSEIKQTGELGDSEYARNLLYVVVTRARKNLEVVYLGQSSEARKVLEEIFSIN